MNILPRIDVHAERFFRALKTDNTEEVLLALKNGMPPDVRNEFNVCALNVAAALGNLDVAKALIAAGANVNQLDQGFQAGATTPLLRALRLQSMDMAELLLDSGANPRIAGAVGLNAAHDLFYSGNALLYVQQDKPRAMRLFERIFLPAFINDLASEGRTVLRFALTGANVPDVFDLILERGADPEIMDFAGKRALHRTWSGRDMWAVSKIVEHGGNINSRDDAGASPLFYAADVDAAETMLALGADIHHVDNRGRNALAALIDTPSAGPFPIDVATRLVVHGISTSQNDYTGRSVEDRLHGVTVPTYEPLISMINARRARSSMTQAMGSAPRPS